MTAVPQGPINAPIFGIPRDEQTTLLRAPLADIELGTYDERILTWIVDTCDTPTVAVIASLLHRARAAQPLPAITTFRCAWSGEQRTGKFLLVTDHIDGVWVSQQAWDEFLASKTGLVRFRVLNVRTAAELATEATP